MRTRDRVGGYAYALSRTRDATHVLPVLELATIRAYTPDYVYSLDYRAYNYVQLVSRVQSVSARVGSYL